jgi:hypothetical protein
VIDDWYPEQRFKVFHLSNAAVAVVIVVVVVFAVVVVVVAVIMFAVFVVAVVVVVVAAVVVVVAVMVVVVAVMVAATQNCVRMCHERIADHATYTSAGECTSSLRACLCQMHQTPAPKFPRCC